MRPGPPLLGIRQTYYSTPPEIGNLELWYRSDLGVTESGGAVSAWADQSGNGRDLAQATGTNQPTVVSAALNGWDAISFDGSNDRMTGTCSFSAADITLVEISQKTVATSTNTVHFEVTKSTSINNGVRLNGTRAFPSANNPPNTTSTATYGSSTTSPLVNMGVLVSGGTSQTVYEGTTQKHQITASIQEQTGTFANICVGAAHNGAGFTLHANIYIYELIFFSKALSSDERTAIYNYAALRYAL